MAYKFQLGAAKLSGSIQLTDGEISGSAVDDTTAANIVAQIDDTEIPISKLAAKTISGKDLGGDLDALTSGNGISMSSYNGSAAVSDLTIQRSGSDGSGLKLNSDGLAILISGSTGLNLTNDGIRLNAVPNQSLSASSVTLTPGAGMGTLGTVSLGASITVGVDGVLEDLDALTPVAENQIIVGTGAGVYAHQGGSTARDSLGLGTGDNVEFSNVTGVTGSFSGDLTVTGDLTILGGVVSASVETLKIQDAQITVADGVANLAAANTANAGFEVGNALASFTVQSGSEIGFNFSSSLPLQAGTLSGDSAFIDAWEISSTHISGNLPVSASAFYGDGSNLSGVSADNASELDFNIAVLENTANVVSRFTKVDSTSNNAFTVTMPLIAASNDGAMFVIKDYTGNCASEPVTVAPSGSQYIEGAAQNIILESGFAAVTMVATYNAGTNPSWLII